MVFFKKTKLVLNQMQICHFVTTTWLCHNGTIMCLLPISLTGTTISQPVSFLLAPLLRKCWRFCVTSQRSLIPCQICDTTVVTATVSHLKVPPGCPVFVLVSFNNEVWCSTVHKSQDLTMGLIPNHSDLTPFTDMSVWLISGWFSRPHL